ncbi:MAG: hypothetical protein WC242_04470 [Candidatus Paceibacterota bacterium]|jgi:hypothetical protein
MMQYLQYLVFVGAAVNLSGIFFYIRETVRGNTKPNKVTWLMWSIAPLIATFAALSSGIRLSVLPVFMAGFGPLLVLIVSFLNKKSYWKLEKFDYLCGLCSLLALILWGITKEPAIAIIFALASDGFAAVPTLIKSWRHSSTESASAYTAGIFSALTSFAAIKMWNFNAIAFPIYLVVVNSMLVFAICRKKIFKKSL